MLDFHTAGESHGKGIIVVVNGLPAGLPIDFDMIAGEMTRRRNKAGSGPRMSMEGDEVEILAGIRWAKTLGSPIAGLIRNRDYANWQEVMNPQGKPPSTYEPVTVPRPGHADLAGAVKYRYDDLRNVIERASARETAGRCFAGALARNFLAPLHIEIGGWVESIGEVKAGSGENFHEKSRRARRSPVATYDAEAETKMLEALEHAGRDGDTLGGTFVVVAFGVMPGLGTHVKWDERLDTRIAGALMGIPAIKGVEVGDGFANSRKRGSEVHDEIIRSSSPSFPFTRRTNRCGGIEGGVSNGETVWARCAMKPIPTLLKGLQSVDLKNGEEKQARYERSDTCAVARALVVAEAMLAWEIARACRVKFSGDSMEEVLDRFKEYRSYLSNYRML